MPGRRRLYEAFALGTATAGKIWSHPENRRRRCRALGRYAAWQVWERTAKRPWRVRLTTDRVLLCHPHSTIASGVLYYRLADYMEMRFLLHYLRPGDAFLDVGANVGVYSLLASSVPEVQVLGFEPSTLAYGRAQENLALNPVAGQVRIVQRAVGAEPGTAMLTLGRDAVNEVVRAPGVAGVEAEVEVEPVEMVTLDAWLDAERFRRVALVKIDVEGLEVDVLRGARRVIAAHSPALIVEVNDSAGLQAMLDDLGYTCWRYDPQRRQLESSAPDQHYHGNVIALRDVSEARRLVAATATARPS